MSAAGADNADANSKYSIFTIKDTKLYVPVVTLPENPPRKCQNILVKDLQDQFNGMKQKIKKRKKAVRIKMWQMSINVFSNKTL